jgi:hypothetical protein
VQSQQLGPAGVVVLLQPVGQDEVAVLGLRVRDDGTQEVFEHGQLWETGGDCFRVDGAGRGRKRRVPRRKLDLIHRRAELERPGRGPAGICRRDAQEARSQGSERAGVGAAQRGPDSSGSGSPSVVPSHLHGVRQHAPVAARHPGLWSFLAAKPAGG